MKSEHISPKLVNSIFLTPGRSGLERGITQGKFCASHRTLVKILCKQSENFVKGAVINYKVILSLSMRLQIVANHPLSPGLSSLWYLGFTLLCNLVSVLMPFLHDTLMLYAQSNYWRKFSETSHGIWDAENKADFFILPSAIPNTIFLSVKNTGLKKLIRVVRVIFIICLKLIIVDIKYH